MAASMTLAAFAQTPVTVGVSMHPTNFTVRGTSTNFHQANADRGVATVDTLATLAALTKARHGAVVDVRGISVDGDLQEPVRYVLNTNSVAATNRIVIANAGGSGRWVHPWKGDIRVFGAVCDGIADDGPSIDAAWAASRHLGYRIVAPHGTNRIVLSSARTNYLGEPVGIHLWVTNATDGSREIRPTIVGQGAWNTTLKLEGEGTGISIHGLASTDIIGLGASFIRGMKIQGIRIIGDGTNSQTGIDLKLCTFDAQMEDVTLQMLGNQESRPAMKLDRCWNMRFQNIWWDPAGWGNFGIDNFEANQQDWLKYIGTGEVGNSTNSWEMRVSGGEKSRYSLEMGTKSRYGFIAEQLSGVGGNVNQLLLQAEGPATGLVFDRVAPRSYVALTNDALIGYLTYTNHRQIAGTYVTLAGVSPSAYNGTRFVLSVVSTNQFTVALGTDPGGPGSGGTWQPEAWCENWDVQFYGWSYAGSIHNTLTDIDRPLIDIRRGKNITLHDSSVGTLHYRTATATNISLRYMTNSGIYYPYVRAQFASHPFSDGDIVSLRFASNQLQSSYTSLSNIIAGPGYLRSSNHNILVNEYITLSGVTPTNYNGYFQVTNVVDEHSVIFRGLDTNLATGTGSGGYWAVDPVSAGINIPGEATNVTANEVWWRVPGVTLTSDRTNVLSASDLGASTVVTAPNFPVKISPDSYNIRLKNITYNNSPYDWTVWDEQPLPSNTDSRLLPWLTQTPPVVFSTNWNNLGTGVRLARATLNPAGINYRSTFLQDRVKAVQLRCRFQASFLGGATPMTNEHVTIRFASPEQNVVSQTVGTPLSPVTIVQWRCADASVDQPYYQTVWVPTDRYGYYTYQAANANPLVICATEIIQVGVEVE